MRSFCLMFAALLVLPTAALAEKELQIDPKKGGLEAEGPGEKKKKIPAGPNKSARHSSGRSWTPPGSSPPKNCVTCKWVYSPAENIPNLAGLVREAKKDSVKSARGIHAKAMARAAKENRAARIKALKDASALINNALSGGGR